MNRAEGRGALQYIPLNGDPFTVPLTSLPVNRRNACAKMGNYLIELIC